MAEQNSAAVTSGTKVSGDDASGPPMVQGRGQSLNQMSQSHLKGNDNIKQHNFDLLGFI